MSENNIYSNLSLLGTKATYVQNPQDAILEKVPNINKGTNYVARFTCPEFTSLCPVTGQPDFAVIVIDYIPNAFLLESKSLKLFLQSFRNHGDFHEACTMYIAKKIIDFIEPIWFKINAYWYPRGGIPIDIFYQTGVVPEGVWIEPITISTFRGR